MGGLWRTAEFSLAMAGVYAALSFGGDPKIMMSALAGGLFFAQLGIWSAKPESLSRKAKIVWAIFAVILFVAEGCGVYLHAHPTDRPPAPLQQPLSKTPLITSKPMPKGLPNVTARWTVIGISVDPPFDAANIQPSYEVKIGIRNDGDAPSSKVNARHAMRVSITPLDRSELDKQFKVIDKTTSLDVDFLTHTSASINPGQVVFTDLHGPISSQQAQAIHSGIAQLYVPVKLSWIDGSSPEGMYRTEEFCGIIAKSSTDFELCDYHNTEPRLKRLPVVLRQMNRIGNISNNSGIVTQGQIGNNSQ